MILRRLLAPVASLTAVLALSACAGLGLDDTQAPSRPAVTPSRPQPAVAPPPARPGARAPAELNALRPSPRPTIAAAPGPAVTAATPPRLVGLSEDETVILLGHPAEETQQPPGKIWLYRAGGCQLAVHLFPDMEKGGFYALDYGAEGGRDSCLDKVANEARKHGGTTSDQSSKAG